MKTRKSLYCPVHQMSFEDLKEYFEELYRCEIKKVAPFYESMDLLTPGQHCYAFPRGTFFSGVISLSVSHGSQITAPAANLSEFFFETRLVQVGPVETFVNRLFHYQGLRDGNSKHFAKDTYLVANCFNWGFDTLDPEVYCTMNAVARGVFMSVTGNKFEPVGYTSTETAGPFAL